MKIVEIEDAVLFSPAYDFSLYGEGPETNYLSGLLVDRAACIKLMLASDVQVPVTVKNINLLDMRIAQVIRHIGGSPYDA